MLAFWTVGSNPAASCRLFSCIERFCAASKFKCLITKACYQKDIDKLKDHSTVTDDRANGIPFKDKGSKSLKTHFGQDVTRLGKSLHSPEECQYQKKRGNFML